MWRDLKIRDHCWKFRKWCRMEIPQPMWSLVLILNHLYGEDFSCSYLSWISLLQMITSDWHPVSIQPHHCAPPLPSSPCSPDCSLVPGHIPNFSSISHQVNIEEILVWYLCYLCRKPSSWWLESLWRCRAFPSPRKSLWMEQSSREGFFSQVQGANM